MSKKFYAGIAFTAASVLALAGCSSAGPSSGSDNELSLSWVSGTEDHVIDPTVKAFEAENKGVTVDTTILSSADIFTTLQTQLTAGNAPDLFLVEPGVSPTSASALGAAGRLASLDDLPWATDGSEAARTAMSADGSVYAVTPDFTSIGAIYNADSLAAAGLTAPTTWTEVLDFCKDASAQGKIAYGLGLQEGWTSFLVPRALLATLIPDVDEWNAQLADGSFDYATSAEWKEALEKQNQMRDAGCFNDSPAGTSMDNTILPGVVSGDYLATVSVSAHIGVMESKTDEEVNLVTTPLPSTDDAAEQRFEVLPGSALAINADSKNIKLAKKFLELWSEPASLNKIALASGTIPSVPNDDYVAPASLEELAAANADGRTVSGTFLWGSDTQQALVDGVQGIFVGSSDIDATLKAMQAAYESSF